MKPLTPAQVLALLRARLESSGQDQAEFAKVREMSPQYLSDVLKGNRRMPRRLLDYLGLERVEIVRRKKKGKRK